MKLYVGLGFNKTPPSVIHLNYNGNTGHVFESYFNQISKMAMYLDCIEIKMAVYLNLYLNCKFIFELKYGNAMYLYLVWLSCV